MIIKTITPDLETDEAFILSFCGFYGEVNSYSSSTDTENKDKLYMCTLIAGGDEIIDQMFRSIKSGKNAILSTIEKRMTQDLGEPVVLTLKSL